MPFSFSQLLISAVVVISTGLTNSRAMTTSIVCGTKRWNSQISHEMQRSDLTWWLETIEEERLSARIERERERELPIIMVSIFILLNQLKGQTGCGTTDWGVWNIRGEKNWWGSWDRPSGALVELSENQTTTNLINQKEKKKNQTTNSVRYWDTAEVSSNSRI